MCLGCNLLLKSCKPVTLVSGSLEPGRRLSLELGRAGAGKLDSASKAWDAVLGVFSR